MLQPLHLCAQVERKGVERGFEDINTSVGPREHMQTGCLGVFPSHFCPHQGVRSRGCLGCLPHLAIAARKRQHTRLAWVLPKVLVP